MKRRSRTTRVLKWAGLVGCLLIVVAWGVSTTRYLRFVAKSWHVSFGTGCFFAFWSEKEIQVAVFRVSTGQPGTINNLIRIKGWNYDAAPRRTLSSDLGLRWPVLRWARENPRFGKGGSLVIPCWLMLPFIALPTAFLWYRDRRQPRGHCQTCGYDLTGNVSGVCPECGIPT